MPYRNYFHRTFLLLLFISSSVHGLEMEVNLYSDLEYSTNIEAVSYDTQNEMTQILGLDVELKEERKRFNITGSFNIEEEHYYQDTFTNKTSWTTGFGVFNLDVIEQFLNWRTSYSRTKVLSQFEDNETPDNYEQREITRTGPAITYRISETAMLGVLADYIFVKNSEEDVADTKRANAAVNYNYAFSPTTAISLNSNYNEILDAEGDEELKNANVNMGISRDVSNGKLKFNVGRTRSWSDDSEAVTSNFFDVSFVRKEVFWHDLSLRYNQDLSDTSIGFESDEEGFEDSFDDTAQGDNSDQDLNRLANISDTRIDIIQRRSFDASLQRAIGSYQYLLAGFWESESYEIQNDDQKSRGFNITLKKKLMETFSLGVFYGFALTDYLDRPDIGKSMTRTYRVNSQFGISEHLGLAGFLQYKARQNSRQQTREFEEFSTGISINWALL